MWRRLISCNFCLSVWLGWGISIALWFIDSRGPLAFPAVWFVLYRTLEHFRPDRMEMARGTARGAEDILKRYEALSRE